MKKSKKQSFIFKKYFSIISAVIIVSYLILMVAFLGAYLNINIEEKKHNLSNHCDTVAQQLEICYEKDSLDSFDESTRRSVPAVVGNTISLVSKCSNSDVFVCDSDGSVIFCKDMMRHDKPDIDSVCEKHGHYKITSETITEIKGSDNGISVIGNLNGVLSEFNVISAKSFYFDNDFQGIVFAVQSLKSFLGKSLLSVLKIFALAGVISLIIAFICVYYISSQLIKPIEEFSRAVKSYANGDFSVRISIPNRNNNDELVQLSMAVNAMAQSLSVSEASTRSFVANVSHELKTPMTIIGGFIDGILDGTIPQNDEKRYLVIVSSEVKRLSSLVVSMLNLSKIEAGKIELKPKHFNLSSMIISTLLTFEQKIENSNINIVGLDSLGDVFVNADEDMINQVVYNYIDNAVKFTPQGGTISFRIAQEDDKIRVFIRNTGQGISSENLSRVFERFYKVDSSRSYDVKGAGLGLYLVKTIVELHGGTVVAKSTEGQYAEFSFSLPYNN